MTVKTQAQAHIDAIQEGKTIERDHNNGENTITVSFGLNDLITDVVFEINWNESADGFDYELTAIEAFYFVGVEKRTIDLLNKDDADLAVTAAQKATGYIDSVEALHESKWIKERDAMDFEPELYF